MLSTANTVFKYLIMNICIVEDSIPIQERLKRLIEQLPELHVTGIVGDNKNAEKLIFKQSTVVEPNDMIHAIVLDSQLPDGNSLDLLKKIKQDIPSIKIVVFTNHASDDYRLLAKRAGADEFLDKSNDCHQLAPLLQFWQKNFYETTH